MLKVFTLYIIDRIFSEECFKKPTPLAQILYINCITHHFRNLEAREENANSFEMPLKEFPNFEKHKKQLVNLEEEGLVDVNAERILFYNVWSKYISKSQLDISLQSVTLFGVDEYKQELYDSDNLIELSSLKYKISETQVKKLIDLFVVEQREYNKKYQSYGECVKHLTYWMGLNHHKTPKETIKSNNKMLGK
jgi:hypothetical protein